VFRHLTAALALSLTVVPDQGGGDRVVLRAYANEVLARLGEVKSDETTRAAGGWSTVAAAMTM
jgi:hypothetical protein